MICQGLILRNEPNKSFVIATLTRQRKGAEFFASLHYFVEPQKSPLKLETRQEMLRNHCDGLNQPWGIGWMLANSHDVYYQVPATWRRYGLSALVLNPEAGPAFRMHCSASAFWFRNCEAKENCLSTLAVMSLSTRMDEMTKRWERVVSFLSKLKPNKNLVGRLRGNSRKAAPVLGAREPLEVIRHK